MVGIIEMGDKIWKLNNPDTKMCTPNAVYIQMEYCWEKWNPETNETFHDYVMRIYENDLKKNGKGN